VATLHPDASRVRNTPQPQTPCGLAGAHAPTPLRIGDFLPRRGFRPRRRPWPGQAMLSRARAHCSHYLSCLTPTRIYRRAPTRSNLRDFDSKRFQHVPIGVTPIPTPSNQCKPGSRGAALRSMERLNVRRAPQAIKHVEPVYPHDPSCGYIPYPVPMVSRQSVDASVDSRGDKSSDRIVEQCGANSGRHDNTRRRQKAQTRHVAGFVSPLLSG
jgi:hypothetical protein